MQVFVRNYVMVKRFLFQPVHQMQIGAELVWKRNLVPNID